MCNAPERRFIIAECEKSPIFSGKFNLACPHFKFTPCASFLNRDFAPFGATKALRPWNPTGKVPVPNT